jgi:hypothetical protein
MADQGRWFKLWVTAPSDDSIQALCPALRWAWAALGCYVKVHGTHGRVIVNGSNAVLAAEMGVTPMHLIDTIAMLPHVHVDEGGKRHGEFTVTFQNWVKYQEDSTQAQRASASRSKKRRDEKRRDEMREPPSVLRTESPLPSTDWPENLQEVREYLVGHNAPPQLLDPAYWRRIDDWLGAPDSGVGYLDELAKYLAWLVAQPRPRRHVDLKRGFRNWLAKSQYWSERRAQTEAHRASSARRR